MIQLKAENFADIVAGKAPKIMVPQDEWDNVLKIIKEMPTLEKFEEASAEKPVKVDGELTDEIAEMVTEGLEEGKNAFEEMSKRVKERLNGQTKVSAKKN